MKLHVEVQRRLHFPLSVVTTPAGRKPNPLIKNLCIARYRMSIGSAEMRSPDTTTGTLIKNRDR
jgi:hypothetical protein